MAKIETTVVFNTDDAQTETTHIITHIRGFPFKGQITRHEWNGLDWIYEHDVYIYGDSKRIRGIKVTDRDEVYQHNEVYQYNENDELTETEYNAMKKRVIKAMKNWNAIKNR